MDQLNILQALKDTSEAISQAPDIQSAMNIITTRLTQDIHADACSIFLIDDETQNFNLISSTRNFSFHEGQYQIQRGEGLISRVAHRGEVLNIEDSQKEPLNVEFFQHDSNITLNNPNHSHPISNSSNSSIGSGFNNPTHQEEEIYHGFLAAPMTHQGRLLGIAVAEKLTRERFSEEAVSFLVTLLTQLAESISHALAAGKAISSLQQNAQSPTLKTFWLSGTPASNGIGIGEAQVAYHQADLNAIPEKNSDNIHQDIEDFLNAISTVSFSIDSMEKALENSLSREDQLLFNAYKQILQGHSFKGEIIKHIQAGQWVQSALKSVVNQMARNFDAMEDEYLKERASDIKDIGRRVLAQLQSQDTSTPHYPSSTILIGSEITASMLAEVPSSKLKGIISGQGSSNSHVAILARALNIPAIMGVKHLPLHAMQDKEIILDGYTGRIYLEPSQTLKRSYERLAEEERVMQASLKNLSDLPAETLDGRQINLYANIGLIADIDPAIQAGAMGVGLYRTEIPFMVLERFPSEEEQRVLYRQVLQAFSDHTVTMRSLDAGGDKILPYFHIQESNPYLGWRGIRMLLDHPEIFLIQIRAMLRASIGLNNLQILLPMISKLSEVKEAKLLIRRAYEELKRENLDLEMPKIGAMIEVPSAIFQLDKILQYVDFISVGSNDLTQYLLAVDRNNSRVERFYNPLHPSVIQAIWQIAKLTKQHHKPLSLCGELASDPLATLLLIGMGFDSLSMNASALPKIKWIIRTVSFEDCQKILEKILKLDRSASIKKLLQESLIDFGLGGLVRSGKF